jgi:RecB family exonuclease
VVASAIDGLKAAPMLSDLEESRLREASGVDRLDLQPIAARHDLPLGAGLSASNARATSDFTEFDGNLFSAVDSPSELHRVLESVQRISASGIETWATCPFQFFLGRVLRVTSTDRPEDGWTVDPLERGSLIHDILEHFFKELQRQDRLDHLDDYTPADHHLLDALADECFAELERRGVTGHPLVWENTSAAIRADLRTFLVKDERWRREEGWRPRYFEQAFGIDDPASWAPLELEFAGTHVRFRGYMDRVDVHRSGRRAFLYDYKTGGRTSYAGMENDPVLAGKHVQLALYRRAVLASIPDLEDVDGAYWFVSSRGEFKMLSLTVSQLNADQRLADVLEGTARGILAGAFPQVPGNETVRPGKFSWDNCAYCAFDRICPAGRDAVFERKQATPGYTLHASLAAASTHASDA